jgi:G:T-mismatch repair DNA endonuclease (very short patch repair protein)
VDGDFWHGRDWLHARQRIKSNKEFWFNKIERNMARDRRTDQRLKARGWRVLRFWASDVLKHLAECANRVEEVLREEQIQHLHRVYQFDTQYDTLDQAAETELQDFDQE